MPDVTATPVPSEAAFPSGYRPAAAAYDELFAADGSVRPHCTALMSSLAALGATELDQRWREARRMLRENGVTYNVYDDVQSGERPWALDPIPLLLTSAEWQTIERALVQRAQLFELVLADLYGPQTLLRRGLVPAEAIFAHAGFAPPCAGVPPPRGRSLPLYAADLGRRAEGRFCVLGDRAQAPSGSGYALENRVVLSRALPSLFRDSAVHRLPLFFRRLRAALAALSPRADDSPHLVMLTPGPGNETYFEHAFLASYLGCTLAQGDDLTVRDQRVWLRTLEGLRPVDVIIRRIDDAFCDPLELRGDSLLGVPGLLQVARQERVAIVNPLGSSVIENPALMALLPRIARELLGEDLVLPSVRTWWCGNASDLPYVLERLAHLVIRPLRPHGTGGTLFGNTLDRAALGQLSAAIRARPYLYAAQEHVALSTAPTMAAGGRLEPRALVLRAFLAADASGYTVMPGGLARVAATRDSRVVSNQRGGVSKDVWLLAAQLERDVGLLSPADRPLSLARGGQEVPGRVADDLFWVGRYAERAEGGARALREVLRRVLDPDVASDDPHLPALLRAVTLLTATFPGFAGSGAAARMDAPHGELRAVIFDVQRTGSLRFNVAALARAGRAVRDRFSSDTWRVISRLDREFVDEADLDGALDRLDRILLLLAAFGGLSADSMSRGQRWRFLEIGRRIERALAAVALLRAFCLPDGEPHAVPWEAMLTIADASTTYRRRYRSGTDPGAVLDLLIDDETNPRSVLYQLLQLAALVDGLGGGGAAQRPAEALLIDDALAALHGSAAPEGPLPRRIDADLVQLLAHVQALLGALSEQLGRTYFSRGAQAQQLVPL
jgi:uncharacterized circularly permuted ATP-grasp superfamily protein/uncharacterized alpha-E superfamily protein